MYLIRSLSELGRYGFTIWLTSLLYDRGKRLLPYGLYLKMIECRHKAIERFIRKKIGIPKYTAIQQNTEKTDSTPIWFLWFQGENDMPDVVRLCYKSVLRNHGKGKVILLTEKNIDQYVILPVFILEKYKRGGISKTHLSDILRMALLSKYGGLWMDSTILLTAPIPDEVFDSAIYCIHHHRRDQFVFKGRWSIFFMSVKNRSIPAYIYSYLIRYFKANDGLIDYFLTDYLIDIAYKSIPEIRDAIDSIPINNPQSTKLKTLIGTQFNEKQFADLTSDTWAFKMSYKGYSGIAGNSSDSYYSVINSFSD